MNTMINEERDLAKAIQNNDVIINISEGLCRVIAKINEPSAIVWLSVTGAIATILLTVGKGIVVLFVPGSFSVLFTISGVTLAVLGLKGMLFALKLAHSAGGVDILTQLRDRYVLDIDNRVLKIKPINI